MRQYRILYFFYWCGPEIKKDIHKILCYFGIHTVREGIYWSANYMRLDCCVYCNHSKYVQDKASWLIFHRRQKAQNESRKVLFEKTVKDGGEVMDVSYYLDRGNWLRVR